MSKNNQNKARLHPPKETEKVQVKRVSKPKGIYICPQPTVSITHLLSKDKEASAQKTTVPPPFEEMMERDAGEE